MAINTIISLVCDGCKTEYKIEGINKGMLLRNQAARQNWIYTGAKDLCPNCRPKTKAGIYPKQKIKATL